MSNPERGAWISEMVETVAEAYDLVVEATLKFRREISAQLGWSLHVAVLQAENGLAETLNVLRGMREELEGGD